MLLSKKTCVYFFIFLFKMFDGIKENANLGKVLLIPTKQFLSS